jgi:hypothetical protein
MSSLRARVLRAGVRDELFCFVLFLFFNV